MLLPSFDRHIPLLLTASLALGACHSTDSLFSKGPHLLLSGNVGGRDTVSAQLTRPLMVGISGALGKYKVRFRALTSGDSSASCPGSGGLSDSTSGTGEPGDSVSAAQQAEAWITLGHKAGPEALVVSVDSLQIADTVTYTVEPGQPVGTALLPRDTAMYVTSHLTLNAAEVDRCDNAVGQWTPTSTTIAGTATLGGSTGFTVTPTAYGTVTVIASSPAGADTSHIVVVPSGTLAASMFSNSSSQGLVMFNLDGSDYHELTALPAMQPRWSPSGAALLFDYQSPPSYLQSIDTTGAVHVIDSASQNEYLGIYSRDGKNIFYTVYSGDESRTIWKIPANGTGHAVSLEPPTAYDFWGSPSPDGSQLAVTHMTFENTIAILDATTGQVTPLNISGTAPSWAPQGTLLAYTGPGGVDLINADGSGQHTIAYAMNNGAGYNAGVDWSPDAQWVVASNLDSRHLELINVTSGLILPLDYTYQLSFPTWRPDVSSSPNTRSIAKR